MDQQRILIEFIGGDWDGKTLDSQSADDTERQAIDCCLYMTDNGTVGKAFHGGSISMLYSLMKGRQMPERKSEPKGMHKYTVFERLDEDNEVLIRIRYSIDARN
jgi:hypothetical protein